MKKKKPDATTAIEELLAEPPHAVRYVLRLYVTGMTPRSTEAIASIKAICEEHLHGRYDLEVIDIYQRPALAQDEQIIAVPTLVKKLPAPLRRLIGNLSDKERVLMGLDLLRKK
jgi:circadian clock protein KaiB